MQKDDVISGLGAVGSAVVIFIGFLWNLGLLQLVFSFLAGSFSTYFIQNRLQIQAEKRRIERDYRILMRDKIYGPLYEVSNLILSQIKNSPELSHNELGHPQVDGLKGIIDNYLFLLAEKPLKELTFKIRDDLFEYAQVLSKAERAVIDVSKELIIQAFPKASADAVSSYFCLLDYTSPVENITLKDALLTKVNPFSMFREKSRKLENPSIKWRISEVGAGWVDIAREEKLFAEIEKKVWGEKRLIDYDKKRQELLDNLTRILPELRKKVEG
jgi:hypothetical protein